MSVTTCSWHDRFPWGPQTDVVLDEFALTDPLLPVAGFHRLTGIFVAPWSGIYKFNLTTNGRSELWLSTSAEDPTAAVKLATASIHSNEASRMSTELTLVKGFQYYVEVIGQGNQVVLGAVLARAVFNHKDTSNAVDERQELTIGYDRILEVQELTLQNPGSGHAVISMNGKTATVPAHATESQAQQAVESLFDVACSVSQDSSIRVFGTVPRLVLLRSALCLMRSHRTVPQKLWILKEDRQQCLVGAAWLVNGIPECHGQRTVAGMACLCFWMSQGRLSQSTSLTQSTLALGFPSQGMMRA
jgi:hypothetical protein